MLKTILCLLSDRQTFLTEIHNQENLNPKISALLLCSFSCFALYGAIIGAVNPQVPQQILSSAIKLPILYLLTLIVCIPTLYIFNAFFGSRQTLVQHLTYLLSAVTVIAILLCGFSPVTLFFLLSIQDKLFFLLLNLGIFSLTGILGVSFLYQVMRPVGEADDGSQVRTNILRFWLGLYGFVGTQLGWTLRPFFATGKTFEVFRPREGSFFSAVWSSLQNVLHF